jgi:hypothetical protein
VNTRAQRKSPKTSHPIEMEKYKEDIHFTVFVALREKYNRRKESKYGKHR